MLKNDCYNEKIIENNYLAFLRVGFSIVKGLSNGGVNIFLVIP